MEWKWPKVDDKGLARFINSVAGNFVRLSENRQDLLQREDGRRQLIEAIYNTLLNLDKKIRYAPEKYHPSEATQLIRKPCEIIDSPGEGTCLDLAAFFCGVCLANDLLPLLIVLEGHALAAVSLNHGLQKWDAFDRREKELFREPLTNISQLHNLVDSGQYLVIECTGFAQTNSLPESVPEGTGRIDGFLSFDQAIVVGRQQLNQTERPLRFALDIAVAHYEWGIEPLSQATESSNHHLKASHLDVNPQLLGGATLQDTMEALQRQLSQHQQLISSVNATPEILTDERHSRIEVGCKLIKQGKSKQALEYLTDLKAELWEKELDPIIKYRLLANIGMAKLGLEKISEATEALLEAKDYNPENEKALAFAAMGYTLQENYQQAEELIQVVLQKNSANSIVHSLRVQMASSTDSIEEIVNRVPLECRNSPDVMAALGQAALDRELYSEAEQYFQAVVEQSEENTDNIKVLLGFTLVKSISQHFLLILAGQIDSIKREKLERALTLFTDSLGGNTPHTSDLSPTKFVALVNRGNVLRLLKRYNEANRDIEIALELEPTNYDLIRQRALIYAEKGEIAQAISYLQEIPLNQNYELLILTASLMGQESRFKEAINLLENIQFNHQKEELKAEATRLKVQLYLDMTDYESAREISQSLLNEEPNNILNLVTHINVLVRNNNEDSIRVFIEQAKASLELNTDIRDLVNLADLLYRLEYYRDAVEVYEKFVDKKLNNHFTYQLLNSYFYAGDHESAINLCEELINQHGIDVLIPHVSEIATLIYQSIDDFSSVRKIYEQYLRLVPNDISMQLRLAVMNYETDNFEDLDRFLDSNPNIDNLSFDACQQLASLYKITNKLDKFFELIYEIRKQFHDDEQVHTFYLRSYAEGMNLYVKLPHPEQKDIKPLHLPIKISGIKVFSSLALDNYCHQSFQKVESTCGVFLINKLKSNNAQWYILDENLNKNSSIQELCPTDTLYKKLIGNSLGHEVKLSENPLNKNSSVIIAAIIDKYFAAYHISTNFIEVRPEIQGFSIAQVPSNEKDGIDPDWLEHYGEMLKECEERFNKIKSLYTEFKIPFGLFAIQDNRNPIELWEILVYGNEPCLHCWSNPNEKLDDAVSSLQKQTLLVIDIISLLSIYELGLADIVVQAFGKFGVAQSTLELLRNIVLDCQLYGVTGCSIFAYVNGQQVIKSFSPEEVAQRQLYFEQLITWVRNNCHILPCKRVLTINRDERIELNKMFGSSFVDTLFIASEPGRILYSDDQWLRYYAKTNSGIQGVWTQVIINYCLQQKYIDNSTYCNATLQLIYWGYNYTPVNAQVLLAAAKRAEWSLKPDYTVVLKVLENQLTPDDYMLYVAAEFIYKLYNEEIFSIHRDYLIFELLKAITKYRSSRKIIHKLTRYIQSNSPFLLHITQDILGIIKIWKETQNFMI
jgi:tetratricopeptide (TPR) repeat protein